MGRLARAHALAEIGWPLACFWHATRQRKVLWCRGNCRDAHWRWIHDENKTDLPRRQFDRHRVWQSRRLYRLRFARTFDHRQGWRRPQRSTNHTRSDDALQRSVAIGRALVLGRVSGIWDGRRNAPRTRRAKRLGRRQVRPENGKLRERRANLRRSHARKSFAFRYRSWCRRLSQEG